MPIAVVWYGCAVCLVALATTNDSGGDDDQQQQQFCLSLVVCCLLLVVCFGDVTGAVSGVAFL